MKLFLRAALWGALALGLGAGGQAHARGSQAFMDSDLFEATQTFARFNPGASLAEIVAFANHRLAYVGYNYYFDFDLNDAQITRLRFSSGGRMYGFIPSRDDSYGPCGENPRSIPVARFDGVWLRLPPNHGGGRFKVNLKIQQFDSVEIQTPAGKRLAVIASPDYAPNVVGVRADGRAVYIQTSYWDATGPLFTGPDFEINGREFLILEVDVQGRMRFMDDPRLYRRAAKAGQRLERIEGDTGYTQRFLFPDVNLVAVWEGPCT